MPSSIVQKLKGSSVLAANAQVNVSDQSTETSTESQQSKRKTAIITLKDVVKKFRVGTGFASALNGVTLDVFSTDFTIVYGPSGCGKSTMLNIICGLEPPDMGSVVVRDVDVYSMDENARSSFRAAKFGVVYQMPYWVKSLDILDNVAMPLLLQGSSMEGARVRATEALERVGMDKFEHHLPTELSGGQQQKAAVARAIISNPWIIIADEPTGNLDSHSALEVMNLFLDLNTKSKRSVIMVTHNLDYLGLATRTVAMEDGKIIAVKDNARVDSLVKHFDLRRDKQDEA